MQGRCLKWTIFLVPAVLICVVLLSVFSVLISSSEEKLELPLALRKLGQSSTVPCAFNKDFSLVTREECERSRCLWQEVPSPGLVFPKCFFPKPNTHGYKIMEIQETPNSTKLSLQLTSTSIKPFPNTQENLDVEFIGYGENLFRIRVTVPESKRYEVPVHLNLPDQEIPPTSKYNVTFTDGENGNFILRVTRKSTNTVLFDTSIGGMVYSDQFLQISTKLPSKNLYGFGENSHYSFLHNMTYKTWPLFARDQGPSKGEKNLYGSHPVYYIIESDGNSHAVFWLNSNAMEVETLPDPGLTMRAIGGIMDFFFFMGPTPSEAASQYMSLVGFPYFPPYWSLGFQLCRYGHPNLTDMEAAMMRTRRHGVPQDVQYADIDHMQDQMVFSLDRKNFRDLPNLIVDQKKRGLRFIVILDPAINAEMGPSYMVHQRALEKNVYITWPSELDLGDNFGQGRNMLGYVWPLNRTSFPDWLKKNTSTWWKEEIIRFYQTLQFDGLWIDMNEPANFGTNLEQPWNWPSSRIPWSLKCPNSSLDDPPYTTKAARINGDFRLSDKTICMVGVQGDQGQYTHYDVHNLYGWAQGPSTLEALRIVTGKRGLVVSRSTYPSSGRIVGHWLGDNSATWDDLRASIIGMMEFNLFGFPYIGADICGFFGDTTEELCLRWMQLGAFYPYSRNHNTKGAIDHDPGKWPKVASYGRDALQIRYRLLPYLYTLHYLSSTEGATVIRPLSFQFPTDPNTWSIDDQFLWGDGLLIAPIVYEGQMERNVYLPRTGWYDYNEGLSIVTGEDNKYLSKPKGSNIPIFVRSGVIIPMQEPGSNTALSRDKPLGLLIAPDEEDRASGLFFWDDGESIDTIKQKNYYLAKIDYAQGVIRWNLSMPHILSRDLKLGFIRIFNIAQKPNIVWKDQKRLSQADLHYNPSTKVLELYDLDLSVDKAFELSWNKSSETILPCPISYSDGWNDTLNVTEDICSSPCLWNSTEKIGCRLPPSDQFGYKIASPSRSTDLGFRITLERISSETLFGNDWAKVDFEVFQYSSDLLRFKFTNPSEPERYEVPLILDIPEKSGDEPMFDFYIVDQNLGQPFAFYVTRKDTGNIIFDTRAGGMNFADQFLSITTLLPSKNLYGLGENNHRSFRHDFNQKTWPIFNRDQPPEITENLELNLYGSHPFYQVIENDGNSHGVLLLNSNALDYQLLDHPSITFRTIGGILDFFIFMGPTPETVVSQYTGLVGRPAIPPYWALGFHLCRYGYQNTSHMRDVVERTRKYLIPQDSIFGDIDMMDRRMDFTIDSKNFLDIPLFADQLHEDNIKFVPILDPAINAQMSATEYPVFERGLRKNVFMTWPDDTPNATLFYNNPEDNLILGYVWPENKTAFPNFHQLSAHEWWTQEILTFYKMVAFDGLWIDMNEPAVFDTNMEKPWNWPAGRPPWNLNCSSNKWEDPPYVTKAASIGPSYRMSDKTLCMSSMETPFRHYDTHNIYGWSQIQATISALQKAISKRPLLVSRSTFVGSGQWGGHWLGDNAAVWEDMRRSVIGILEFNLFGIPYIGADICGFFGNTTEELCQRWMQLGAFYPFSRNHNGIGNIDQDPGVWQTVASSSKKVLEIRYSLLPYLYTLFYVAQTTGGTVVRPLTHEFPKDRRTYNIDSQFLWGSCLMISPVLTEGASDRQIYFPFDAWYDYLTGSPIEYAGESISVQAARDTIPLHVRGGCILPRQKPGLTTTDSRTNPFNLLISLDLNRQSVGKLFWDDGASIDTLKSGSYDLIDFTFDQDTLVSNVTTSGKYVEGLKMDRITIYGVEYKPTQVFVNGNLLDEASTIYERENLKLEIKVYLTMKYDFTVRFENMWI